LIQAEVGDLPHPSIQSGGSIQSDLTLRAQRIASHNIDPIKRIHQLDVFMTQGIILPREMN
jgi:hypothetical protein